MPRRWRPVIHSALPIFLAACGGGGQHLATIEPISGSRTHEGGEIIPLDSAHSIRRTAEGNRAREIVPLAHRAEPVSGEIRPLDSRPGAPSSGDDAHEIRPLGAVGGATSVASVTGPADTLLGTTWEGRGLDGDITLEFLPGGTLRYTTADETHTNGTWQQQADSVSFEMNAGYAEWTGRLGSTRMAGSAHNRAGRQWQWRAIRQ